MATSNSLVAQLPPNKRDLLPTTPSKGYLESLNLYRVIACAAVVGNHSFIWANMSTNVIGTGFITMLHLSRNAFFFLSGLVICYSQIAHPRGCATSGGVVTSS